MGQGVRGRGRSAGVREGSSNGVCSYGLGQCGQVELLTLVRLEIHQEKRNTSTCFAHVSGSEVRSLFATDCVVDPDHFPARVRSIKKIRYLLSFNMPRDVQVVCFF